MFLRWKMYVELNISHCVLRPNYFTSNYVSFSTPNVVFDHVGNYNNSYREAVLWVTFYVLFIPLELQLLCKFHPGELGNLPCRA